MTIDHRDDPQRDDPQREDVVRELGHLGAAERERLYAAARAAGADAAALQAMALPELRACAASSGIAVRPGLGRQELHFLLLQHRCAQHGLGWAGGVLEVMPDGFGFLRAVANDFAPGPDDVYLSPGQIHHLNLKSGLHVEGPIRPARRGELYLTLVRVELVNGRPVDELAQRVPFDQATAVLPRTRLRLDAGPIGDGSIGDGPIGDGNDDAFAVQAVALLSPLGLGQRVLLQAPPGSGRLGLLVRLVAAALRGAPDLHAIVCLLAERPEDVTEARRHPFAAGRCTVVATTFDETPQRHVAVADLALAQSMRLVEYGQHVLLAFDSLTALVRACQQDLPPTGRVLAPGLEVPALQRSKKLFAAGRSLEAGASLTVLASVVTDGTRIDDAIAAEFAGKGNAEIALDRALAGEHVQPPLDALRTATRREDCLLDARGVAGLRRLRQQLQTLEPRARLDLLRELLLRHRGDTDAVLAELAT